jgi:hypothetical protein
VIDDTQIYLKQEPSSKEKLEDAKTSFLLWPCADMASPCLSNTLLSELEKDENYADVKEEWKGSVADWIKSISTQVG